MVSGVGVSNKRLGLTNQSEIIVRQITGTANSEKANINFKATAFSKR